MPGNSPQIDAKRRLRERHDFSHGAVTAQAPGRTPLVEVSVIKRCAHDEVLELAVGGFDLPRKLLGHLHGSIALDVSHTPAAVGGIVRNVNDSRFQRNRDATPVQVADHSIDLLGSGLEHKGGGELENIGV